MSYFYLSFVKKAKNPMDDKFIGGTIIEAKDAKEAIKNAFDEGIVQCDMGLEIVTAEVLLPFEKFTPAMKAYIGRLVPAEEILSKNHLTLREAMAMSEGKPN